MFMNPYKNRKKTYLTLELIVTVGVVVFAGGLVDGDSFSTY